MIDIELFKKILSYENEGYIEEGDYIDSELLSLLAFSKVENVKNLFKKSKNSNDGYNVELYCANCGGNFVRRIKKTRLYEIMALLRNGKYKEVCEDCKETAKRRESALREQERLDYQKEKLKRTDIYIDNYLNADNQWNKNVTNWSKIKDLANANVDWDIVADYIKGMDYSDFLDTPYWTAIAERIKIRAKNRCQICNSDKNLNAHHRSYENHGDEIHHMEDLVCICSDCHSKYHCK